MNTYAKDIIKHLDRITSSGNRPSVIFEDFLDLAHATLEAIPSHLRAVIKDRVLAPDTEATTKLLQRLHARYTHKSHWQEFTAAFHILLDSADGPDGTIQWDDTIGQVYMEWGVPNKHTGQFFTPYEIARLMATMQDIEEQVHQRIEAAYLKSSYGAIHLLLTEDQQRVSRFIRANAQNLVHLFVEHIEPLTVNDCACGSGVMLLAAAEQTPRWALDWGIVQFSGQDIDATCVRMAQINMMIYGLNGYNLKNELAIAEAMQEVKTTYEVQDWKQPALMELNQ